MKKKTLIGLGAIGLGAYYLYLSKKDSDENQLEGINFNFNPEKFISSASKHIDIPPQVKVAGLRAMNGIMEKIMK